MDLYNVKQVIETSDFRSVNRLLKEGWFILSIRVNEELYTQESIPFKQSTIYYSMGTEDYQEPIVFKTIGGEVEI